jgi:hypothetical protein
MLGRVDCGQDLGAELRVAGCGVAAAGAARNAMGAADGSPFAMSIRSRRRARRALDADSAEDLLAGQGAPPGAPAGQQALARLLELAAGPGSEQELAGEVAAAAMFVQVISQARSRRAAARRVLAAVACVLAVGGAAVYGSVVSPPSHTTVPVQFGVPVLRYAVPAPDVTAVLSRQPGTPQVHPEGQGGREVSRPATNADVPLRAGSR